MCPKLSFEKSVKINYSNKQYDSLLKEEEKSVGLGLTLLDPQL